MINYELKPTSENLKKTILEDSVGRNSGILDFIKFLDATDGNIAVALNDSWGNGKTFFVKQVQMVLQSYDESKTDLVEIKKCIEKLHKNYSPRNYIPVYYDAWSNDNDEDPILSIMFEMLRNIAEMNNYEVIDKNWWDRFTNGLEVLSTAFGGPRIKNFLDSVKGKDILGELKKSKETAQILNEIFDTLLQKQPQDSRIVFFIDELDRCCPNFAVKLLERIKHYFLHNRVIFVLSINEQELQHTIKRHYGNDFDAHKYLNRFFDFNIPLPSANMRKYYQTINFIDGTARNDVATVVIQKYNFSLREITRYMQYLKVALYEEYRSDLHPEFSFYNEVLIPFMIGLHIHDFNKYTDFINGENCNDFIEIIHENGFDVFYCRIFLQGNETFSKSENAGQVTVSFAEKFQPIYECLFGKKNSPKAVRISGRVAFYAEGKEWIKKILALTNASRNLGGASNGTQ